MKPTSWIALALVAVGAVAAVSQCSRRAPSGGGSAPAYRPNILLISIDTLRADHLGCYGYERATSPFIDELAAGGVRFERCYAAAPNTAPSHVSLMTSLFPIAHSIANAQPSSTDKKIVGMRLPNEVVTLADILQGQGYRTAAFADGGNVNRFYGLAKGFRLFESKYEGVTAKVDQSLTWLRATRESKEPFFLFMHTYEVHEPYLPPDDVALRFAGDYDGWLKAYCFDEQGKVLNTDIHGFADLFNQRERLNQRDTEFLKALYDAEIVHTDRELRRLFDGLKEIGLDQDLLVILVSDHGEEFREHGDYGHKQLHEEVARVPLIVWGALPFAPARKQIDDIVSLVDVLPTVADLMQTPAPDYAQGRSLVAAIQTTDPLPPRPAYAEYIDFSDKPHSTMMRRGDLKFIHSVDEGPQYYDLAADAAERTNLLNSAPRETLQELRDLSRRWLQNNQTLRLRYAAKSTGRQDLPLEELRQLGY